MNIDSIQALIERGALDEAIAAAQRLLPAAAGEHRAQLLLTLSSALWTAGQYLESLRNAIASNDEYKACGSRAGACDALVRMASALRAGGDAASAVNMLEQAETLARELADPLRIAQVLRNMGVCCSLLGRHQQALSCFGEAVALHAAHGAAVSASDRLGTLLSHYNAQNRHTMSLPAGTPEREAALSSFVAQWAELASDCAKAGLARLEVLAHGNHAITLLDCGRHAEARAALEPLLARYAAYGMRPNEGLCHAEIGRCDEALGQPDGARDHYRRAIEILQESGTLVDLQSAWEGLARVEETIGDAHAALAALKQVRQVEHRRSDESAREAVAQRELRIELARLTSQWAQQAVQDPLTGLGNRRALDRWLEEMLPRSENGESLSLLLLDLDHFKQVNDRFGHGIGDEVLRRVALLIQHNCRSGDLAVRYGGEEFLLALSGVSDATALEIAQRLRESVASQPWDELATGLHVSISIGIAQAPENANGSELLMLADQRLYKAKFSGRNRVVAAG